jgi:hypothetical protein
MSTFFDYDPLTGLREDFDYDEMTGQATIRTTQDVELVLSRAAEMRNTGVADSGIKRGMWHYAYIPATVGMDLYKKGINVYGKHDGRALMREINANYPWLKTTNKTHDR